MTQEDQLSQLMQETQRRRRLKTDLSDFDDRLKEMMHLNISLPVIVDWLATQDKKITLQALRRYIRRTFGEEHYDEFLKRNGWIKTKDKKEVKKAKQTSPAAPDLFGVDGSKDVETNPLRKLSGSKKPGEFNPIPSAKIEFE